MDKKDQRQRRVDADLLNRSALRSSPNTLFVLFALFINAASGADVWQCGHDTHAAA
jgi:hypothetical protein